MANFSISKRMALGLAFTSLALSGMAFACMMPPNKYEISLDETIRQSFMNQGFTLSAGQISQIRENVQLGIEEICKHTGVNNSKSKFTAVEIAQILQLNTKTDNQVVQRINTALQSVASHPEYCNPIHILPMPLRPTPAESLNWSEYYDKTLSLNTNDNFLSQLREKAFSPVKISWEDIGRYQESVWGDRISDVGIWVRKNESDLNTAQLALSVRRDNNYRDKVLVVPAEKIKIHQKVGSQTIEKTLPQRLKELGLSSALRDKNVIVSNQFSIVPVPAQPVQYQDITRNASITRSPSHAPRVAFNFSIYPYGSTNYVITDVIEGSSDAVVGPGNHQLLYANINGQKAPFTASRAAERQDLLQLEQKLKAQGMDVDVQRYYLIQIPLKRNAGSIQLSNMGNPPNMYQQNLDYAVAPTSQEFIGGGPGSESMMSLKKMAINPSKTTSSNNALFRDRKGLEKVAIGHGETEGSYFGGSGYHGQRADEPIRVTVVYFVTPVGAVTQADIQQFANTFESWDNQAIWGGSFVTPNG